MERKTAVNQASSPHTFGTFLRRVEDALTVGEQSGGKRGF